MKASDPMNNQELATATELEMAFAETKRHTVIVVPVDYSENIKLTSKVGEINFR